MKEREFHPGSVRSILVLRLYFIGDVLLSTPVLAALRDTFTDARITVVLKRRAAEVLERNPDVDEVLLYDAVPGYHSPVWTARFGLGLRRRRFDLAVDLTGDFRSSWMLVAADPAYRVGFNHAGLGFLLDRSIPYRADGHVVDHLLKAAALVGAETDRTEPRIHLAEGELRTASDLAGGGGPYVAMAPGANNPLRRWPAERYGGLARRALESHGLRTIFVGSPTDRSLCSRAVSASDGTGVSLAGRTSLRTLAGLLGPARAFVGSDSGPLHIAAAVGTPVVGLYGPNTPDRFSPRGAPAEVVARRPPCSPCGQRRCTRDAGPCVEAISVDEVEAALDRLLARTKEH
ncbi:MAG: lipopolysaccharide heptosyltransferase II [Candidatus Eisenbacteria bacterium]|nr:lipopolysaccharide heptosyltransferase II [Candidatus Eisenbacteria bacterium]